MKKADTIARIKKERKKDRRKEKGGEWGWEVRGEIEDVYKVSTDNTNVYLFTSYVGLLWLTTGRPRAWRRVSVSGGCFCACLLWRRPGEH